MPNTKTPDEWNAQEYLSVLQIGIQGLSFYDNINECKLQDCITVLFSSNTVMGNICLNQKRVMVSHHWWIPKMYKTPLVPRKFISVRCRTSNTLQCKKRYLFSQRHLWRCQTLKGSKNWQNWRRTNVFFAIVFRAANALFYRINLLKNTVRGKLWFIFMFVCTVEIES